MKSTTAPFLALIVASSCSCQGEDEAAAPAKAPPAVANVVSSLPASARAATPPPPVDWKSVRWLAIGGGSIPELNHVSIEQDIALAQRILGKGGRILFAGGHETESVQVRDKEPRGEPLRRQLGELFSPRGGRDGHYRRTTLPVVRPATADDVQDALQEVLSDGASPLLLYLAGHGEMGEKARDNWVGLWGNGQMRVSDLAAALDEKSTTRKPVRVVATTCFSGGFAELVFDGADEERGAATSPRCGVFAAPFDLPASGCDPNPNRMAQQGYALHFLNGLMGKDRYGRALPKHRIDFDGDGTITLLEAHTRVRTASDSADVPTATTERWLRANAPSTDGGEPFETPEERAVIDALGKKTKLGEDAAKVRAALDRVEGRIAAAREARETAIAEEDQWFSSVAAELLSRWPVLDDPWHPDFEPMLAEHRVDIAAYFERSVTHLEFRKAQNAVMRADAAYWELRREAAPVERLMRAIDNRILAGHLKSAGGAAWKHYEALLACERSAP